MARTIPLSPATTDAGPPPFARIGIVGLGLIGGSIGRAARAAWRTSLVVGVDRNDVLEAAQRVHAVDVSAGDLGMVADVDLIVLATPAEATVAIMAELDAVVPGAVVVTDVSGATRQVRDAALRLPGRFTFVGGYPQVDVAGGSILHASPDLFRGRPWLLTPGDDTPADVVARLEAFVRGLGAEPERLGADAFTQRFPEA